MTPAELFEIATKPESTLMCDLQSSRNGLITPIVHKRLKMEGFNVLKQESKSHVLFQLLSRFKDPLILVLILVAFISFSMGEIVDATIVIVMVILSSLLNFIQEYKASNAAAKLKHHLSNKAMVWRDNKLKEINTSELVRGDIVELNAGDLIPADMRILESNSSFSNQSTLTGESMPVAKQKEMLNKEKDLNEFSNILFAGTSLLTGTAKAIVVATGSQTQFGSIATSLSEADEDNEFVMGIKHFSLLIVRIISIFVIIIFGVGLAVKGDILSSLAFAVAVAVGLTPEFLPMILTVAMSKGSMQMAKKGVIVKKLNAIPTLGSMDILCTDKTGTLTADKIELVRCLDFEGKDSANVLLHAHLNSYFQSGLSNPMDRAVLNFRKINIRDFHKIGEIPYDFNRKKMSVIVAHNQHQILITKGAPEEILDNCVCIQKGEECHPITVKRRIAYQQLYEQLSQDGFRVLAVGIKKLPQTQKQFCPQDEQELSLLGFTAFLDPAKNDARKALDELEAMGIEVKIVTGDNELVAAKICNDVDVKIKGILTGSQIEKMNDISLREKAEHTTIFARVSPDLKNRIIKALRQNKHVVGYMGDGINDAMSLQTADVGISVANAVDVAREAADIILTHKSLHQLKDGVENGRQTFGNTMKYLMMGISSNFGNMFSMLVAVIFLPFLPMLPIQILLNNFIYDLSQLTIPTDKVDTQYTQTPKRWNLKFIQKFMFTLGPISSLFDCFTFGILYLLFKNLPSAFQTGWFMESLATQILVIHIIRTKKIPFIQSAPSLSLLLSTLITVLIGWSLPYLFIGKYFGLVPLPLNVLALITGIVLLYLCCAEITKRWFYRRFVF